MSTSLTWHPVSIDTDEAHGKGRYRIHRSRQGYTLHVGRLNYGIFAKKVEAKAEAQREENTLMATGERSRHRRRSNPGTGTWLVIGGGIALLGIGAYFLLKPASDQASTKAPQLPPGGRPFGDPNDPTSTAYACTVAYKLQKIGHPIEAASWAQKCTAGGGSIQIYS